MLPFLALTPEEELQYQEWEQGRNAQEADSVSQRFDTPIPQPSYPAPRILSDVQPQVEIRTPQDLQANRRNWGGYADTSKILLPRISPVKFADAAEAKEYEQWEAEREGRVFQQSPVAPVQQPVAPKEPGIIEGSLASLKSGIADQGGVVSGGALLVPEHVPGFVPFIGGADIPGAQSVKHGLRAAGGAIKNLVSPETRETAEAAQSGPISFRSVLSGLAGTLPMMVGDALTRQGLKAAITPLAVAAGLGAGAAAGTAVEPGGGTVAGGVGGAALAGSIAGELGGAVYMGTQIADHLYSDPRFAKVPEAIKEQNARLYGLTAGMAMHGASRAFAAPVLKALSPAAQNAALGVVRQHVATETLKHLGIGAGEGALAMGTMAGLRNFFTNKALDETRAMGIDPGAENVPLTEGVGKAALSGAVLVGGMKGAFGAIGARKNNAAFDRNAKTPTGEDWGPLPGVAPVESPPLPPSGGAPETVNPELRQGLGVQPSPEEPLPPGFPKPVAPEVIQPENRSPVAPFIQGPGRGEAIQLQEEVAARIAGVPKPPVELPTALVEAVRGTEPVSEPPGAVEGAVATSVAMPAGIVDKGRTSDGLQWLHDQKTGSTGILAPGETPEQWATRIRSPFDNAEQSQSKGGEPNAIQERIPTEVLPREQGEVVPPGGERLGMGQGVKGEVSPGARQGIPQTPGQQETAVGGVGQVQPGKVEQPRGVEPSSAINPKEDIILNANPNLENSRVPSMDEIPPGVAAKRESRIAYAKAHNILGDFEDRPDRKADKITLNNAIEKRLHENVSERLAAAAKDNRPLTDEEIAGASYRLAEISGELKAVREEIKQGKEANPETGETLSTRESILEGEAAIILHGIAPGGTALGRGLRAMRMVIEDNFEIGPYTRRLERSKGSPLTEPELVRATKRVGELEALNAELERRLKVAATENAKESLREARGKRQSRLTPEEHTNLRAKALELLAAGCS